MSRSKLPDRRPSVTRVVEVFLDGGNPVKIMVTVGFCDDGRSMEVFCADFKAGTAIHAIIMDACVLLSRLLQYGDEPRDIADSMCQGPSVIGCIAQVVAEMCPQDIAA